MLTEFVKSTELLIPTIAQTDNLLLRLWALETSFLGVASQAISRVLRALQCHSGRAVQTLLKEATSKLQNMLVSNCADPFLLVVLLAAAIACSYCSRSDNRAVRANTLNRRMQGIKNRMS